jgi:SpoIIAA-like
MIDILPGLPANVVGFKATGEVTREDFEKVVFPGIKKYTDTSRKLNFIFFVDTPLRNFSTGAWIRDIWLGVKKFAAWHKVAIVSDVEKIRSFTDSVSHILPGEYRGFLPTEYEAAVQWAAATEEKDFSLDGGLVTQPDYIKELLPIQVRGNAKEMSANITAASEEGAVYIFERARERVLDINNWTDHCRPMATSFQLTDDTGEALQGRATEGDFIQIDLPGGGTRDTKGYDWVRIEKVELHTVSSSVHVFLMQTRPARDPQAKGTSRIAHFLEESATSSFVIERNDKKVTATVFGRNEVPNSSGNDAVEKPLNGAVGSSGAIGFSKGQWKSLLQGLLERE